VSPPPSADTGIIETAAPAFRGRRELLLRSGLYGTELKSALPTV
jgi:hypothetical protein